MHENPIIHQVKPPYTGETESKWIDFLHRHTNGFFFQSPEFLHLFDNCKHYEPLVLVAEDKTGQITGVLTAIIISERIYGVPFQRILVQGGPVVSTLLPNRSDVLRALLTNLKLQVRRKTVFVEIRNLQLWDDETAVFEELGFEWHDHLNDILELRSGMGLSGIKPAKQRQIRRGIENGAEIRPATSEKEIEEFYTILRVLYKNKVRKPLPPLTFFLNFFHKTQQESKGVILVVSYKGSVIGGMVCPFSGNHTIHEWYICSVQDRLKHLYPGVLATWAGIDFAGRNNFSHFDFMGIGSPQKPYGVRNFKTRFGGEVINFGRWQLINNKFRYQLGLLGYKLLKSFPKP